jgi:hypothetical protein
MREKDQGCHRPGAAGRFTEKNRSLRIVIPHSQTSTALRRDIPIPISASHSPPCTSHHAPPISHSPASRTPARTSARIDPLASRSDLHRCIGTCAGLSAPSHASKRARLASRRCNPATEGMRDVHTYILPPRHRSRRRPHCTQASRAAPAR